MYRVCQISLAPVKEFVTSNNNSIFRSSLLTKQTLVRQPNRRSFNEQRNSFQERLAQRQKSKTIGEQVLKPAGETAFSLGQGAVAGGALLGIGSLCYYGLGLSGKQSALDQSMLWPQYVKDRIKGTYMYLGGSLVFTAVGAVAAFRSPALLNFVARGSFFSMAATIAALIGSGMIVQSLPYTPGFGTKQLAWMAHSGIMGAVIAPLCLLGGPLAIRAAVYTAAVVGGLSTIAVCAPSDKFLYMGGPLAIGLGVVFASSIGSMFLPATTALGAGLYSISIYGGLLLFSGFLLYDTQRVIRAAEVYPQNDVERPFDPINASIGIYLDTINIFVRILMILSGGGSRRK